MKLSKGANENLSSSLGNIVNNDKLWKSSISSEEEVRDIISTSTNSLAKDEKEVDVNHLTPEQLSALQKGVSNLFEKKVNQAVRDLLGSQPTNLSNPLKPGPDVDWGFKPLVVAPRPSGVSEKDVPEVSFRMVMSITSHPLNNERVWIKIREHDTTIYKISIHTLNNFKNSGRMKLKGFDQDCLPHPIDNNLIILGSDFEDGFVYNEDNVEEISYWRIKCKTTGALFEIDNY